jgi:GTP-binding protein EngB required for normal cell division
MYTTNEQQELTGLAQTRQWIITARTLAEKAGCEQAIRPILDQVVDTQRETINIAVVGGPNSGKSSRINALLGHKVLPVSGLASNCAFTIQPTGSGEGQWFTAGDTSVPLKDLASAIEANPADSKKYRVHVDSDWLSEKSIQLIEKPALDAIDEELDALIEECLRGADLVVLLIDALMPVRRSEVKFMNGCVQRKLPLIVAMSKADKVPNDERATVTAYVVKHAESYDVGIPVVDTYVTPTLTSGIDDLRQEIGQCLSKADLSAIRREEVGHVLQAAINIITVAVQASVEAQNKSQAELDREIKQRKHQIESMSLEWMKLDQAMHQKRQKLDDQIRIFLEENHNTVIEGLFYDLERNTDVKAWWQRDLPFRLHRELKSLASQLSVSINKKITDDIKWLQDELLRRLKFPLQILAEPTFSICETGQTQEDQKKLPLSDSHLFRIISRLGTAASVIMAGSFMVTAGIGGIGLAASVLAGLTAEQVALYNTRKDRSIVRSEIEKLVRQASHEYAIDVSHKLKAGYDEILSNLKQHQERWQQAQLQSLTAYAQKNQAKCGFDWQDLLRETNELKNEIGVESAC